MSPSLLIVELGRGAGTKIQIWRKNRENMIIVRRNVAKKLS
jgi:hypothetical protein